MPIPYLFSQLCDAEEFAFAVKVIGSAPAVGLGLLVSSIEMEG
jgi:hypothetical protein